MLSVGHFLIRTAQGMQAARTVKKWRLVHHQFYEDGTGLKDTPLTWIINHTKFPIRCTLYPQIMQAKATRSLDP